jgi:WD40 repeat protein
LKVWDTESGDVLVTIRDAHAGSVALVNFSPDGKSLVSSGLGDEVKVWDSAEGKPLRTIHCRGTRPSSLAVSPDGKKIATGGREKVKIWDATTGQCLLVLLGNTEAAYSRLQFSPDGKRVSSAEHVVTARGVSDQTAVRVWELLE